MKHSCLPQVCFPHCFLLASVMRLKASQDTGIRLKHQTASKHQTAMTRGCIHRFDFRPLLWKVDSSEKCLIVSYLRSADFSSKAPYFCKCKCTVFVLQTLNVAMLVNKINNGYKLVIRLLTKAVNWKLQSVFNVIAYLFWSIVGSRVCWLIRYIFTRAT